MHEKRNFWLVLVLIGSVIWTIVSWFVLSTEAFMVWPQRIIAPTVVVGAAAWLLYAFTIEDKLPDHLQTALGESYYYEADGVCFMPIVRVSGDQAELSLYYQNRFENPAEVVVHLRPSEECFVIRPGMRDVHFAFKADGGDFGVIHQPIAVPRHLQGDVVDIELAAASHYPRSHGARLRRRTGMPCGSVVVDWSGAAFKSGVREASGDVELVAPTTIHLSMPTEVAEQPQSSDVWTQERLAAGATA